MMTAWSRVSPWTPWTVVPNAGTIGYPLIDMVCLFTLKLALVWQIGITDDGHDVGKPGKRVWTGLLSIRTYTLAGGVDAAHTPSSLRTNVVLGFQSMWEIWPPAPLATPFGMHWLALMRAGIPVEVEV